MPSVLILLHEGCEEIEAVTPIDLLRRAECAVVTASTGQSRAITGSHGITLQADTLLSEIAEQNFDLIVLPGGPGVTELRKNAEVIDLVQRQSKGAGKLAAICAAPVVLADAGILGNCEVTSFPAMEVELTPMVKAYRKDRVVLDGPLCTSRGAGTAEEFSLSLIAWLLGEDAAEKIRTSIVARA